MIQALLALILALTGATDSAKINAEAQSYISKNCDCETILTQQKNDDNEICYSYCTDQSPQKGGILGDVITAN